MLKYLRKLVFSREAVLFDAPLFVLKTFIALFVGYVLFRNHSFISKGMISLMLGIVLTLEPVNISGLKNGFDQITASIIGGVITVIVVLIGGVNIITVPLAVTITLYVTLLIDWRKMSIMAVFTSFYLTQAILYTETGQPDVLETFKLRMLALRDIDVIKSRLFDLRKEKEGTIHVLDYAMVLEEMRDFNHYLLDFVMLSGKGEMEDEVFMDLAALVESLSSLRERLVGKNNRWEKHECGCDNVNVVRMQGSLEKISRII